MAIGKRIHRAFLISTFSLTAFPFGGDQAQAQTIFDDLANPLVTPENQQELGFSVEPVDVDVGVRFRVYIPSEVDGGLEYSHANAWLESDDHEQLLSFPLHTYLDQARQSKYVQIAGAKETLACVHLAVNYVRDDDPEVFTSHNPMSSFSLDMPSFLGLDEPECLERDFESIIQLE